MAKGSLTKNVLLGWFKKETDREGEREGREGEREGREGRERTTTAEVGAATQLQSIYLAYRRCLVQFPASPLKKTKQNRH